MNFWENMKRVNNEKETENGAFALKSTMNSMIDAFGSLGAMRERNDSDIINTFMKAYDEDKLLAMKMLFYARDILEGLGERKIFRVIAKYLATNHTDDMRLNLNLVPDYGRWDDLYEFIGTPLENDALEIMYKQFIQDYKNLENDKEISLLGKWLKSENTSSPESRRLGQKTCNYFFKEIQNKNLRSQIYRKKLSALRKKINIVETNLSEKSYNEINYEQLPSKAANFYKKAFRRNDGERYAAYEDALRTGEAKINAKAIYPYEIIRNYSKQCHGWSGISIAKDEIVEAQWKALPNFVTDEKDFLIVADVSGSMEGRPMDVSVSLAIYFAERNKGLYHNRFMTFSTTPELIEIPENSSLARKVEIVGSSDWGGSTNLEKALQMVLDAAVTGNCKPEDLPKALVVITDMEINSYSYDVKKPFTSYMKEKFKAAGYEMPTIVWWNVNARHDTFHAEYTDNSVRFVSGCSATIFKSLIENMGNTPEELMLMTLNSERYANIKVS